VQGVTREHDRKLQPRRFLLDFFRIDVDTTAFPVHPETW
jgi:hypothetical protein